MTDWIGWVATAVFIASYFAKNRRTLLFVQIAAALIWIGYGLLLRARPVVVANALVVAAAAFTAARRGSSTSAPPG
jgi:hypothetical protein